MFKKKRAIAIERIDFKDKRPFKIFKGCWILIVQI
jgi:hypothetical protein